jgi:transposase-like protein
MQKRVHSREFKLDVVRQIARGQKHAFEVCREYGLHESLLSRWRREYRERGEAAFLPQQFGGKTRESLERKRAWDRSYYQRHKIKRQVANYERRARLYEYLQQIKAKARCLYCGENHPAALQFHHRDPSQKEFNVGEFVTRQLGGIEKLKKEIEKCDVVCANCHLKYHHNHDHRQSRIIFEGILDQFERAEQELVSTLEEEIAQPISNNYFPDGIDPVYLTDEFYESLERSRL